MLSSLATTTCKVDFLGRKVQDTPFNDHGDQGAAEVNQEASGSKGEAGF